MVDAKNLVHKRGKICLSDVIVHKGHSDLSAKILYGNGYDGKIALLSPKQCFIFPPLVFASLNF